MESKVKLQEDEQFPRKKRNRAKLVIAALIILFGGIAIGVYNFMNSPQMKTFAILDKIQKFKKAEGTFAAEGTVMRPSFLQSITADTKLRGNYAIFRNNEQNYYAKMDMNVYFSGDKDAQKIIENANVNGDYSLVLTKAFELQWQGNNKRETQQIVTNEQKKIGPFFNPANNTETEEQNALKELQAFLFKGYVPDVTSEGDKTVITIDKAKLDDFIENAGKNIVADSNKFEKLVKKTKLQIQDNDIDAVIKNARAKTLPKQLKTFTGIEKIQCQVRYEDFGQTIKQSIELNATVKQQRDMVLDIKIKLQVDLLYYL